MLRKILNLPIINPMLLGTLRFLGLDSKWFRSRFYRVGAFKRDGLIFIGRNWGGVMPDLYWDGLFGFESETSQLFYEGLQKGMTVLDVGAHDGYFSLLAASKGCRVFAFEPSTMTRFPLREHIAVNRLDVTVVPVALSDHAGHADLYLTQGSTDSGASLDAQYGGKTERVRVTTLDQFVDYFGIEEVHIIKVDVERLEPMVLAGAANTIRRFRPVIYCEVLPSVDVATMEAALPGYRFEHLCADGPVAKPHIEPDSDQIFRNYRFVPISDN